MHFSLFSVFVLAFVNVSFGAPVPVQELDGASGLQARKPVFMNIVKHSLDPEPDVVAGSQGSQRIMNHALWLRELEEEEFERRDVDTSHFRVGIVMRI